jgi:DNA-binding LacI/PurR family transcriptional regulator
VLSLGHRRVAFLTGPPQAPWARERLEGHRKALREAGVKEDGGLVCSAGSTIQEGETAALQMLHETVQVNAIQAVTDPVAVGATSILIRNGLRLPQDVSVIG